LLGSGLRANGSALPDRAPTRGVASGIALPAPDVLPRPLTPDGRVAVPAPASAALDPAAARAGLDALRARGLRVEAPRALAAPHGYLSGTDDERAAELNALFARDDLDAIVCLRGGYGVLRILDRLDYAAARAHPKLVVGYSDITALHLALYAKAGLPGVSGPMVHSDWGQIDADTEAHFWRVVGGEAPMEILGPGGEPLHGLRDGDAEGVLLGGNLSLVAALLGTPYLPDLAGALLFLEDIGETPYRLDGLLARLRLAGVLERLGGLVLGAFTDADVPPGRPTFTVDEVLAHYAAFVGGPVARGLVYGHFPRKSTLPVGVRASLSVSGADASLVALSPVAA
jgi:muramoyltetrapeptide carboxypeptidase